MKKSHTIILYSMIFHKHNSPFFLVKQHHQQFITRRDLFPVLSAYLGGLLDCQPQETARGCYINFGPKKGLFF